MISVSNLSKSYGDIRAISHIAFDVNAGEVVGLLGPNGAGKTTTMRILCGCIGPSEGTVTIDGADLTRNPERAKARIGYLPERPPLYDDMTVGGLVNFAAALRGVTDPTDAVARALSRVGLDGNLNGIPIRDRIVGRLSKGYRQRVGLAAALVHDPSILVLDEPTSGLDPAQRKDLRTLLAALARDDQRTVLISTHILGEIEAVCDRVIVINNGTVVAQDTIDNLRHDAARVRLHVRNDLAGLHTQLQALTGVEAVQLDSEHRCTVTMSTDCRPEIARCAAPHDLLEMSHLDSLEDIYLRLTKDPA